jgi:dTDP-4-dehydrorhamnose reductase
MQNVLITGGSGLLALNWAVTIRNHYFVTLGLHERNISLPGVKTHFINLETIKSLAVSFDEMKPDIVIHTTGLTNIETCESNPDLAQYINTDLAVNVAKICVERNITLVHISTDHLFSASKSLVNETQALSPINVYGKTKALAEDHILDIYPHALVIRTNFYGWGTSYRNSFSDTIIKSLRTGQELSLFQDVFYTPIIIECLVNITHDLINMKACGVLHVVGDDHISKYEFGLKVVEVFKLDAKLIKSCNLSDKIKLVQRPNEMGLSNQNVSQLLGRKLGGLNDHLIRLHQQEYTGYSRDIINL